MASRDHAQSAGDGDGALPVPPARDALTAGQTYEVWWPFWRDEYTVFDEEGGCAVPTWAPGWRNEARDIGEGEVDFEYAWDADGAMLLTIVSLHKPGKAYPERAFYVRQWRDPDGKVFGKQNLRCVTSRALKAWLMGSKTAHLFENRRAALENSRALFAEALALAGGMGRAPCPSQTVDAVPGTNSPSPHRD